MQFTNTLTGKKEPFILSDRPLLYVCGITPYDYAHIGHGRCNVSFDIVVRLFSFLGKPPVYCRNFTDIDDKILHKAEIEYGDQYRYPAIAQRYIDRFHEDMRMLNCTSPSYEPRVTENIGHIIIFIEQLIAQGHAYQAGNDVYFSIETFPEYGKLSKQNREELRAGARIDVSEKKNSPLDFVLWKGNAEGKFWESPWGYGRPGWHIDCSVLAKVYLGEHIDIHGGGLDLIFPHHENEIAQSESLYGTPFVRCWMHCGFVTSNKQKMSKSLGNFFVLHELFEHFDPMVVRYYFIMHHYRSPLEFSFELLTVAQKSYGRLVRLFADISDNTTNVSQTSVLSERILSCVTDDLNTPAALGVIFENIHDIADNMHERIAIKHLVQTIFGLTLQPLPVTHTVMTDEIQKLLEERRVARQNRDWARADILRKELKEYGIDVRDEKL